jgi:hypothetical protein
MKLDRSTRLAHFGHIDVTSTDDSTRTRLSLGYRGLVSRKTREPISAMSADHAVAAIATVACSSVSAADSAGTTVNLVSWEQIEGNGERPSRVENGFAKGRAAGVT